MKPTKFVNFIFFGFVLSTVKCDIDKPCAPIWYPHGNGTSSVCVCTAEYCDEITRVLPTPGEYVSYVSSEAGLRLYKTTGKIRRWTWASSKKNFDKLITLSPSVTYQTIEGFGGAVTDSASIVWKNMSKSLQQHLVNSYYGEKGIGYTMARVPIAGCDFSTRFYTYDDRANDTSLRTFSLTEEDYEYKIPMLKEILKLRPGLKVVATAWTSPMWMKKDADTTCGDLKEEFYQSFADYYRLFIENYFANNVPIWAITPANEPGFSFIPGPRKVVCVEWKPEEMANWIANNLGPTIRQMKENVLILGVDDQRFLIPYWWYQVIQSNPKAEEYMDGIAVHFYFDKFTPPSILDEVAKSHPNKKILYTEACTGVGDKEHVVLGSWKRAQDYMDNIVQDINHYVAGWMDWNVCLNEQGGPNWLDNKVDSPIIVFAEEEYFVKSPMFYAMAHVAKFVVPGSKRIKHVVKDRKENFVDQFAVVTPEDTVVVVLTNNGNSTASVGIQLADQLVHLQLAARSFTTVEFNKELSGCQAKTVTYNVPGTATAVQSNADGVSVTYNTC